MNIEPYINMIVSFFYTNKIIALVVALVAIIFIWKKPGEAFRLAVFVGIMVVVFYLISLMGGAMNEGVGGKDTMTTKSEEVLEE